MRVAVVGAGITGLTTASLLARQGVDVVLLEATGTLGGLAAAIPLGPHTFCPGPQYLWGFGPSGDARRILGDAGVALETRSVPVDFERVLTGDEALTDDVGGPHVAATVGALSPAGLAFVDVLDALGRCGLEIARGAGFARSAASMVRQVVLAPTSRVSLRDKACLLRHRDDSVADVAGRLQVPADELRVLLAAQPIFAESLVDLSVVLFAAGRAVGLAGVHVPVGGVPRLIDALDEAVRAVVDVRLRSPVQRCEARDGAWHLNGVRFDQVVWACSPAVVARLLGQTWSAGRRFDPGHSICCLALDVELDDDIQQALRLRSLSWFATAADVVDFDPGRATRALTALTVLSPSLNAGTPGRRQLVCAYAPTGVDDDAIEDRLQGLLRLGAIHGRLRLDGDDWERFGPGGAAVYGRRKTAASMQRAVATRLPAGMHLAHAGAGIPGVLGCLQLAEATATRILATRQVPSTTTSTAAIPANELQA